MTLHWPWNHRDAAAHLQRVETQEVKVEQLQAVSETIRHKNGIGPILEGIFDTRHGGNRGPHQP
jgi:hypothetical protein